MNVSAAALSDAVPENALAERSWITAAQPGTDIEHPLSRAVVVARALDGRQEQIPREWHEDHRKLQALAAVDGDDLNRVRVGIQPAAALLDPAGHLVGLVHAPPQPRDQRGDPEAFGGRGAVQRLADMAQVGHPALAVGLAE